MKKSVKAAIIAGASAAAVGICVFVTRPSTYIKMHYPGSEIISVRTIAGGGGNHLEYTVYDNNNGFTFRQKFSHEMFPRAWKSTDYEYKIDAKKRYDALLEILSESYDGEYFTRYDPDGIEGLYIFLKEPSYRDMCVAVNSLNTADDKKEYVVYSLKSEEYERMKSAEFKDARELGRQKAYHDYCTELDEFLLGLSLASFRAANELSMEIFNAGETVIYRSGDGYDGLKGLLYAKNYS